MEKNPWGDNCNNSECGNRAREEVVQLYVADPITSIFHPIKELRNFKNVLLLPSAKTELIKKKLMF